MIKGSVLEGADDVTSFAGIDHSLLSRRSSGTVNVAENQLGCTLRRGFE